METNKKYNQLLIVLGSAMIAVSLYLTYRHYMTSPTTGSGTLCNINDFLNCEKAASSALSQLFGVPIAVFGILTGFFTMLGGVLRKNWIKQVYTLSILNSVGCLFLGLYSVGILHSLCPFCTLYYIFSWGALYSLYKKFGKPSFELIAFLQIGAVYAAVIIIFLIASLGTANDKQPTSSSDISADLFKQFQSYEKLPAPALISPMQIIKSDKPFKDNKLQILLFSDFQCPACKAIIPTVNSIVKNYKENISFIYYPYPLDQACHPDIHRPFHAYACKAAYIAYCLKDDFYSIHETLYENQEKFSDEWLDAFAKEHKVERCVNDPKTKETIVKFIKYGSKNYKITATPTMIINGVKIEGGYPKELLLKLLNELLKH